MSHFTSRIVFATVLALGVSNLAGAQAIQANQNAKEKKEKSHPNQVPDTGTATEPDAVAPTSFERAIESVPVRVAPSGMRSATLDESFMEAITVTQRPDGSLEYGHVTGLANAARAVEAAARAPRLLPSRALPAIFPILEEKE